MTNTFENESLLRKNVCYVCHTEYENSQCLNFQLSEARKQFFNNSRNKVVVKSQNSDLGYNVKVVGCIKTNSLSWKKISGKVKIEEAFSVSGTFVVLQRDFYGNIIGKIHYDKNNMWLKTEYFGNGNYMSAILTIKPSDADSSISISKYNDKKQEYNDETLYPVKYEIGSESQALQDEKFGDPKVFVLLNNEMYIYCSKEEQTARINMTDKKDELNQFMDESETFEVEMPKAQIEEEIIQEEVIAQVKAETEEDIFEEYPRYELDDKGYKYNYTGKLSSGKREGRGRSESLDGMTIYDGDYKKDLKDGFGVSYNKEAVIKYAGFWKDNAKNGAGVSFREKDQAFHVGKWENGTVSENVTLFDSDANLKFTGTIIDNQKEGAGVTFDCENCGYMVGKYENGQCIYATIFDKKGNLIYTGEYSNNMKNGMGTLYNETGEVIFKGIFKDNEYLNGTIYTKIGE